MFVFLSFLGRYLRRDEVISLRVWGVGASDGHPVSVPRCPYGGRPRSVSPARWSLR